MAPVAPQPEDPDTIAQIRQYAPNGTNRLRACIRCRLIMTKEQFIQYGCPTCRDVLHMQEEEGRVLACTSSNFQGFISSIRPGAFVSRFNGLDKRLPGCYALTVQGTIPDYILHESEFERESDVGGGLASRDGRKSRKSQGGASPSLHLTEDTDFEASEGEGEAGDKPKATAPTTSPAAPGTPSDKGLFSPAAADEALKGLFSPASDEQGEAQGEKEETSPSSKRRKIEGSVENILEPEGDTEFGGKTA
mmetsp:Transcript_26088/g.59393  ORF Transcript_26088/g.59393 Transcript_26088/m.59393 type:complete len:249 (-) Transcript_26088:75-821(-)